MSGGDFFKDYCEVIWNRIPGTCLLIPSVGLIFPCRFLKEGRCIVYDIRPIHCRLFPEALVMENGSLSMYRNCGYECIDRGVVVNRDRKANVRRLKDIDRHELKVTASYFENFKYCVALEPEEFKKIESCLLEINNMERAEKRRELITESIDKRHREKVKEIFMKRLGKLNMLKAKLMGDISVISKSFRLY